MTTREFLKKAQLDELVEKFESQGITIDLIKDLTDSDLRELGVTSMADRKKITRLANEVVGQGQSATSSATSTNVGKGAREERTFFEGVVSGAVAGINKNDDEFDDDAVTSYTIKVTSHRAIIGSKTYLLHNIAAVELGINKGEKGNSAGCTKIAAAVFSFTCFCLAIGMATTSTDSGSAVGCCSVVGLVCLAGLFAKGTKDKPDTYSVRIDASGTSSDAILSKNRASIQEVVDAINQAIVNLNVAN